MNPLNHPEKIQQDLWIHFIKLRKTRNMKMKNLHKVPSKLKIIRKYHKGAEKALL